MKREWIPWIALAAFVLAIWMAAGLIVAAFLWERYSSDSYSAIELRDFRVHFGILGTDSSGYYFIDKETTTLPLKFKDSGFRYGFEIVPPHNGSFTYRCVFHYSATPKVITGGFDSGEPSAIMKTPEVQANGTVIEDYWFDPGDPVGEQSVEIFIDGQLIKTIKYTVVPEG